MPFMKCLKELLHAVYLTFKTGIACTFAHTIRYMSSWEHDRFYYKKLNIIVF